MSLRSRVKKKEILPMPMEKKSLAGKKPITATKTKATKAKVDTKKPASGKVVAPRIMMD